MLGLCRLFTDDTPVGERSLEINNLRSMVNINSCYCNCDNYGANKEHYVLHCKLFANQRNVMLNNIRDLGLDISINNILYGNSDFAYDVNCSLFVAVHRYILDTNRFV